MVLRNISGASISSALAAHENGCIPPLIAALSRHAHLEAVCVPACGALYNFAWNELPLARDLIEAHAVPALVAAFNTCAGARERAKEALDRLGFNVRGEREGGWAA